ncbi:MAG: outer membrane protein transport protein [Paramuribaculum sp.]|nr:outer membrane protein transport protein [Paramuribaculum sp.]
MKIKNRLIIAIAALQIGAFATTAQINSPYSKFGYGLLNDNTTAAQSQMGGVGYALNSGRQINVMNPASYAAADSLTFLFDMGLTFSTVKMEDTDGKSTQYGGGLDYITMQVPISKRMGASLGILPFSSVGYSFGNEIKNGLSSRQGSGGIHQLYLGYAARLFKGFSLGANFSYMFGTTVNDVYANTDGGSSSLFEQVMEVRDWRVQVGAQYSVNLNADNRIGMGVVYSPGKTLLGNARVVKYDVEADEKPDTVATAKLRHNATLPDSWGAGLSYTWKRRLNIGADFTYQPWSKAKTLQLDHFDGTRFADRWQVNVGGEYTHSVRGSYLSRITYRAGGFFNRDYIMVGDNNVREYGVSFGFGLPALSSKTVINLGFEYRHRQAHPNPLLKENYFNIRLGINFNELWFFQNKIR